MSLLRLLTAGKSLVGLQNVTSRYRVRPRFLLPRFGGVEDPFASAANEPMAPAAPASTPARVERYQMRAADLAAARLKETKKIPMPPSAPVMKPASAASTAAARF